MMRCRAARPSLATDHRGAALVEFALLLPVLSLLLIGVIGYGQHFLYAHGAQQLANDAARAAIAGRSAAERRSLAEQSVAAGVATTRIIAANRVAVEAQEAAGTVTVRVAFDTRGIALLAQAPVPGGAPLVERRATIGLPIW